MRRSDALDASEGPTEEMLLGGNALHWQSGCRTQSGSRISSAFRFPAARVPDRFLLVLQRRTARAIAPGSNEAQSLLVVNIASLTLAPTWVAFRGVLFTNSYDVTVMRWPG